MTRYRLREPALLRTFLAEQLSCSVRQAKNILDQNRCQVNGIFERFGRTRLQKGDLVEVEVEKHWEEPEILYQDDHLIVLNKPAGWVSPRAAEWAEGTLVHRLDRDTSGVLLLTKSDQAAAALEAQFRERTVNKSYLAVVTGVPSKKSGEIESQLGVKGRFCGQSVWGSVTRGKWAKTAWEVVRAGKGESLVRCFPKTGRTHQIRVHLAEMGHPIVGDGQYGRSGRMLGRHLLHSETLSIRHPITGEEMTFKVPCKF